MNFICIVLRCKIIKWWSYWFCMQSYSWNHTGRMSKVYFQKMRVYSKTRLPIPLLIRTLFFLEFILFLVMNVILVSAMSYFSHYICYSSVDHKKTFLWSTDEAYDFLKHISVVEVIIDELHKENSVTNIRNEIVNIRKTITNFDKGSKATPK